MAAPPKSILKKSESPRAGNTDGTEDGISDALQRRRDIAIHHARIIQHRKELEAVILDDLILLSEFPPESTRKDRRFTAANPNPADAEAFKQHVRLFQPSDYDDLVTERNVNDLCGYTLCDRPRRQTGRGGEWKIIGGQIARRKDVEMWCSTACAKRAMYVKVQLSETAAWERAGIPDIEIELLEEDRSMETEADRTARKLGELKLEEQRQAASQSAALALERGDRPPQPGEGGGRTFDVTLREKPVVATAPDTGVYEDDEGDHMAVEGYKSKRAADQKMGNTNI